MPRPRAERSSRSWAPRLEVNRAPHPQLWASCRLHQGTAHRPHGSPARHAPQLGPTLVTAQEVGRAPQKQRTIVGSLPSEHFSLPGKKQAALRQASLIFEAKLIKRSGVHPPRRQRGRGLAGQTGLGTVFMAPAWHGQIHQARVQRAPLVLASDAQPGQGRAQRRQRPARPRLCRPHCPLSAPLSPGGQHHPSLLRELCGLCLGPHPQHLDSGWGSGLVGQGGRGEGRGPTHLSEFGFCLLQTNLRPANSTCSEERGFLLPACTCGDLAVPLGEGHQCPDHRGRAGPSHPSHTHRHLWGPSAGRAGDKIGRAHV